MQAATAATLPAILGFGDEAAATPFQMHAMKELMVVGVTDWESNEVATSSSDMDIAA